MILSIIKYKVFSFYKLVIVKLYFGLFFSNLYKFKLIINYDSFAPVKNDIYIYEIVEVKKRVEVCLFFNVTKAICKKWRSKAEEYYRNIIKRVGFETALEKVILN